MIWHDSPYCLCIRKPQVIRNFWASKELVHVHYILLGFDWFRQSCYDIECYNIFIVCLVFTCIHLHTVHRVVLATHSLLLYVDFILQSTLLVTFSWKSFMDVFTDPSLNMKGQSDSTFYYVHYLYDRNIVLNNHYWFSGTEELWNSHSGRISKGTVLVFNSKHIVFVKRSSLNLSFQTHSWH